MLFEASNRDFTAIHSPTTHYFPLDLERFQSSSRFVDAPLIVRNGDFCWSSSYQIRHTSASGFYSPIYKLFFIIPFYVLFMSLFYILIVYILSFFGILLYFLSRCVTHVPGFSFSLYLCRLCSDGCDKSTPQCFCDSFVLPCWRILFSTRI